MFVRVSRRESTGYYSKYLMTLVIGKAYGH